MARKILKSFLALALVASPLPAFAQSADASASQSEGPNGASLWIGISMFAAVLALIFGHDEIFGDNNEPTSP